MRSLRRIFALARKELLAVLKDRRSRLVLIGPPIAQLIVFGYAASFELNHVPIAIYNEDTGGAAREFVAAISGSPTFEVVSTVTHDGEIAPLLDNREALAVIHLGTRFSDDLATRRPAQAQVIIDGRNSNTALIALGYLRSIATGFNLGWARTHGLPPPPAVLDLRPWFNPNLSSRWFIVPGIVGLLTLVVTTMVTALSVAREREAGTFDQLLVTPLNPAQILIGKSLPGLIIGVTEATFIVLVATFWFDVPLRGALPALAAGVVLFVLSAVGIGLMISSLATTQQQGILGAFLFLVPAVILSGFATPIANMPEAVQVLTYANPLRYLLVIVRGVFLEGDGFAELADQYWPMAGIALLSLVAAAMLFRHRLS